MANSRLQLISNHLSSNVSPTKIGVKSPNDVVIVAAVRTPLTKARKGGLRETCIEDMLSVVFQELLKRSKVDPKLIEDVIIGNCLTSTAATVSRMASLHAGIPNTAGCAAINRQCSSGLQACVTIANSIQSGLIDIGIGGGAESMTIYSNFFPAEKISEEIPQNQEAADCLTPMGNTSENVAREFKIARDTQDEFALESHKKAIAAQKAGHFKEEIVPITVTVTDKEGNEKKVTLDKDDGAREGLTIEQLKKLRPAFEEEGTTTAGNSSQVTDGAAGVLLARRSVAEKLGLPIIGKYVTAAVVGVPPSVMGIGPVAAIPEACRRAGISVQDVDIFELNEAFASQATYCINKLGIDPKKVNPKGGAIALGHPLGCTGARLISTLMPELKRQNKKVGAVTMCIGTGMGMCGIFERE